MNTLLLVAAIVEGLFAIGFIAAPGPMLALGWIIVAVHAAFTLWFGAFLKK